MTSRNTEKRYALSTAQMIYLVRTDRLGTVEAYLSKITKLDAAIEALERLAACEEFHIMEGMVKDVRLGG
jgi:hypothetical protein